MIIMGLGFRKIATQASFESVFEKLKANRIDRVALLRDKSGHPELQAYLSKHGFQIDLFDRNKINGIKTVTQSENQQAKFGVGSLCEALAIIATRPLGGVIINRIMSDDHFVTAAIAQSKGEFN